MSTSYCVSFTQPQLSINDEATDKCSTTSSRGFDIDGDSFFEEEVSSTTHTTSSDGGTSATTHTATDISISSGSSSSSFGDDADLLFDDDGDDDHGSIQDTNYGHARQRGENNRHHNEQEDNEEDNDDEDSDITTDLINSFFNEMDKLSEEIKHFYIEALMRCTELVRDESNPVVFLRYCNYDPSKAALALCEYWKSRFEIFGPINAFKSMTFDSNNLRGDGNSNNNSAFTSKDIKTIVHQLSSFIRILPRDDAGRIVLVADRTDVNYSDLDDQMLIIKYAWFVYHNYLQDIETQKNGVVFIIINRGVSFMKRSALKHVYTSNVPMKCACAHFIMSSLAARLVLPAIKFFIDQRTHGQRLELHLSTKLPTVLDELSDFGLHKKHLPTSIGGTYTIKPTWIKQWDQKIKHISNNNSNDNHRIRRKRSKRGR